MDGNEIAMSVEVQRRRSQQAIQITFALLSLGSLVLGLSIYLLAGRLGLATETARTLATAFLIAACIDALVLLLWDRLFRVAPVSRD